MRTIQRSVMCLAGLLWLTACSIPPSAPSPSPFTPTADAAPLEGGQSEQGYPVPSSDIVLEPYPGEPTQVVAGSTTPNPPLDAPETAPGTGSLSGVLWARSDVAVIDTTFYLTPALGENRDLPPEYVTDPNPAQGDVLGRTGPEGQFTLTNIPPGNYFLFVSGPYGWREAEVGFDDQHPLLIELDADERLALGTVHVTWP